MTQRFYFDTSVFGGVFDKEFEEATLLLFERLKTEKIICVYSDLTESELVDAPENVVKYFRNLPKEHLERVIVNDEILALATEYIKAKVVGQTSFDDCVHIAAATVNKVDILVSWNFKHIVNVYRIRGYNSINIRSNYQPLEIRSPKESWHMKTEHSIPEKEFDTVKTFRAIKEKMSLEMANMTFEQIKAYLKEKSQRLQSQ